MMPMLLSVGRRRSRRGVVLRPRVGAVLVRVQMLVVVELVLLLLLLLLVVKGEGIRVEMLIWVGIEGSVSS